MVKMAQKVRRVRWERLVPLARMEQMVLVALPAPPVPRDPLVLPVPRALANAYLLLLPLPPLSPKRLRSRCMNDLTACDNYALLKECVVSADDSITKLKYCASSA
jgi:hypothetical protein